MVTLIRILIIWSLAWLLIVISRNGIRLFKSRILARVRQQRDMSRVETLSGVFRHAASFIILGVAVLLTLDEIGFSITPLLATAGVAGIAIGLGAQSLVRDFIAGLFMLIEGQVSEGDYIETAGKAGMVEEVTLRHLRLRDEAGNVHFIPNGSITTITNSSRGHVYAVIDITVPRDSNLKQIIGDMQKVADDLRKEPGTGSDIAGEMEIDGIDRMEAATMVVRGRLPVAPARQGPVRRHFLRRMRALIEERQASHEPSAL
jgi:small-conductance mechanosensitive channel